VVSELKAGDSVEGFRVLAVIGRGAASVIYLVTDPKTKQVHALKHVKKHDAQDARFLEQAENEARVSARVSHPGLRRVERVIKKSSGLFGGANELWLVMDWVDGTSVDRSPPRTVLEAVHVFQQVAAALAHMHDQGFVHADIKPNNIIVSEDGTAQVIDLGQSCPVGTVKRRIQGTPDYIAPEQVHRRAITPRTDIYNLGATMYWALTHRHIPTAMPKNGDSLVSSLDDELIEKPVPAIELNPAIEPRLNELIMQCVEVDPEKRPTDMHYVADRLNLIYAILKARANDGTRVADAAANTPGK
jgi:serine/threonine-protein kinase